MEPLQPGEGYKFENKIVGGVIPKEYIPAIDNGIKEASQNGVLAGFETVDFKVTVFDGSYHDVDSSEMAFKIAANLAFKAGLPQAVPLLLEPVDTVEVIAPDRYTGDIISDVNKRRGRVMGMSPDGKGNQIISAEIPAAELASYATDLRSMTQSRGRFTHEFVRYEEAPAPVTEKVVADSKQE
jgi:elongation factor G